MLCHIWILVLKHGLLENWNKPKNGFQNSAQFYLTISKSHFMLLWILFNIFYHTKFFFFRYWSFIWEITNNVKPTILNFLDGYFWSLDYPVFVLQIASNCFL